MQDKIIEKLTEKNAFSVAIYAEKMDALLLADWWEDRDPAYARRIRKLVASKNSDKAIYALYFDGDERPMQVLPGPMKQWLNADRIMEASDGCTLLGAEQFLERV